MATFIFLYFNKLGYTLDILFRQITMFIKVRVAFVFGLQTLWLLDFTKIYQLKGLKPKNKGHTKFYDCCDLTKKHILYTFIKFYFIIYLLVFCLNLNSIKTRMATGQNMMMRHFRYSSTPKKWATAVLLPFFKKYILVCT